MNSWIDIKKESPPLKKNILFYGAEGGVAEGEYLGEGRFMQYRWSSIVTDVTHWMQMPCTPKEESNFNHITKCLSDCLNKNFI